jgi:hypothetical protein
MNQPAHCCGPPPAKKRLQTSFLLLLGTPPPTEMALALQLLAMRPLAPCD